MSWKDILKYIPSGPHISYLPRDVSNSYDELYEYFEKLLSQNRDWEIAIGSLSFREQRLANEIRKAFQDTIFESLRYKRLSGEYYYDADKIKKDLNKIKELKTEYDELGWGDKSINFDFHFNVLKEFLLEKLPLIRQRKEQPDPTNLTYRRLKNI